MAHTLLSTHYRKPAADEIDFIFSFVRNPFTWYESTWRILHEERWRTRTTRYDWHPHKTAAMAWHPDFNVWLTRMVNTEPSLYTRLVELYIGPEGESYCDYVGKFENLYHDTAEMLHLSGVMSSNSMMLSSSIPPLNVTDLQKYLHVKFPKPINASKKVPIEWSNENRDSIHQSEVPILRRFYTGS